MPVQVYRRKLRYRAAFSNIEPGEVFCTAAAVPPHVKVGRRYEALGLNVDSVEIGGTPISQTLATIKITRNWGQYNGTP